MFCRRRLRRVSALEQIECRGLNRSVRRRGGPRHFTRPKHCHPADPFVVSELARRSRDSVHSGELALVHAGWLNAWRLQHAGEFSIYREAWIARCSMRRSRFWPSRTAASDLSGRRDQPFQRRLNALMDGTALTARSAAKRRAERHSQAKCVVHPVALRYSFLGSIDEPSRRRSTRLYRASSWRPERHLSLPRSDHQSRPRAVGAQGGRVFRRYAVGRDL